MSLPLRYKICQWHQAVKCLSNNSKQLKITVSDIFHSQQLHGTLLKVEHFEYGTLFAAMTEGSGELVTKTDAEGAVIPWMTTVEILQQLRKFGFDITYTEKLTLSREILDYLMKVRNLGYDKITKLVIQWRDGYRNQEFHRKVVPVAIKSEYAPDYLAHGLVVVSTKFYKLATAGYIYNMEDINNDKLKWDWLDATYNIDDILAENSDIEDFGMWIGDKEVDPFKPFTLEEYNKDLTPYDSTITTDDNNTTDSGNSNSEDDGQNQSGG